MGYNRVKALWLDGVPLTYGGTGYNLGSTNYTKFAFSGDPAAGNGWTEVTPNGTGSTPNAPGDRRGVMGTGPFTLEAGSGICLDIALPFARDMEGNHLTSVTLLKQRAHYLSQSF